MERICRGCGEKIPKERLENVSETNYCVGCVDENSLGVTRWEHGSFLKVFCNAPGVGAGGNSIGRVVRDKF